MVPSCALTTAATIARPSPVLPPRRDRDESPRANRSKISGCRRPGCRARRRRRSAPRPAAVAPASRDRGARRGVRAGVGKQIRQHLVQPGLVADDDDRLVGQVQRPLVIRSGDVGVADGVDDQPRQVDRSRSSGRPASSRASSSMSSTSCVMRPVSDSTRLIACATSAGSIVALALGQFGIARGSPPVACAVRGWRRRRTDAPGSRWRAGRTARRRCGRASGSARSRADRPRCARRPGRPRRSAWAADLTPIQFQVGDLPCGRGNP